MRAALMTGRGNDQLDGAVVLDGQGGDTTADAVRRA
jgi:hypothetical protein